MKWIDPRKRTPHYGQVVVVHLRPEEFNGQYPTKPERVVVNSQALTEAQAAGITIALVAWPQVDTRRVLGWWPVPPVPRPTEPEATLKPTQRKAREIEADLAQRYPRLTWAVRPSQVLSGPETWPLAIGSIHDLVVIFWSIQATVWIDGVDYHAESSVSAELLARAPGALEAVTGQIAYKLASLLLGKD